MYQIGADHLAAFEAHLREIELAEGTIANYLRHVQAFAVFAGNREIDRELALAWREHLRAQGRTAETVNGMLVSLNRFFRFAEWEDCRTKPLRVQRRAFRDEGRELTRDEYTRLLAAAESRCKERLALLMETICGTGIRVSEVPYITVEAAERRETEISLKGKLRRILIPGKLAKKLLRYAKRQGITTGAIFVTRSGRPMSRHQIWAEMKSICKKAGVEPSKVFPHNLRHLFARIFYKISHDIAHLADVLGHSSIETTRIYLISTGTEHRRQLERMRLIL